MSLILSLLQILLALHMLLRPVDQLLFEIILFVLLGDELVSELFVTILHLIDLASV